MAKKWISSHFNLQKTKQYIKDMNDYVILDWLFTFMKSPKMIHKTFLNSNTNKYETFYWIKYDGLLNDLSDILSFHSKKQLKRHLDYMVKQKLLNYYEERNPSGTFTYINFNPKGLADITDEPEINSDDLYGPITPDKSNFEIESTEDIYVREDAIKDNEIKSEVIKDQTKNKYVHTQDINVYPKDTTTNYRIVNNKETTTTTSEKSILQLVKENFEVSFGHSDTFTDDLYNKFADFMKDKDSSLMKDYIIFCKSEAEKKSNKSVEGYFYSILCKKNEWNTFKSKINKQEVEEKKDEIVCPACSNTMNKYATCEYCHLSCDDLQNSEVINLHRKYSLLSVKAKKKYDDAKEIILTSHNLFREQDIVKKEINQLRNKFGLV